jgi:peroxiredoxin
LYCYSTEFCTAKGLAFKLLSDGDGSVSASYGADLKIPILAGRGGVRYYIYFL